MTTAPRAAHTWSLFERWRLSPNIIVPLSCICTSIPFSLLVTILLCCLILLYYVFNCSIDSAQLKINAGQALICLFLNIAIFRTKINRRFVLVNRGQGGKVALRPFCRSLGVMFSSTMMIILMCTSFFCRRAVFADTCGCLFYSDPVSKLRCERALRGSVESLLWSMHFRIGCC